MKKISIALLFILIGLSFSQCNYAQNSPKIFTPKADHSFGEILEGQLVTHEYEIKNIGNAELKIDKVRASCGCTAAQPASNSLKPGESTKIKVEFDSHGRMGLQNKTVYVFTNDPSTPQLELKFNATIVEAISKPADGKSAKLILEKNRIDFGNVEEGKVVESKINFKNSGEGVLEIIDVKTSCGCTAALLSSKKLNPGESGTVKIELDTANREGQLTRTVTLYSNDPSQTNQVITLSANIEKRKS
jgi:hypothetical protein